MIKLPTQAQLDAAATGAARLKLDAPIGKANLSALSEGDEEAEITGSVNGLEETT